MRIWEFINRALIFAGFRGKTMGRRLLVYTLILLLLIGTLFIGSIMLLGRFSAVEKIGRASCRERV